MGVRRIHTGVADTRHLSIYLLKRARRNLHFDPPQLGHRPPTGELITPLYHSLLLLRSPSLRTQLWPTGRRSLPSGIDHGTMDGLVSSRGGGSSLQSPLFVFIEQKGGRLSTVPCVRF